MIISYKHNLSLSKNFFKIYSPIIYLTTGYNKKKYIGNKNNKICRFCNKKEPKVTFNNDAHIIPELLGNVNTLSNFECDNCNEKFSEYEVDLARYLGPIRTFAWYLNSGRNPKFEHKNGDLKIFRDSKNIYVEQIKGKSYLIDDKENKLLKLNCKIEYKPINVYKSIFKIAFCLFNENELKLFDTGREFLLGTKYDRDVRIKYNSFLFGYFSPNEYFEYPTAYLFKKKLIYKDYPMPEYTFVIFFHKCIYQIFLPMNKNDDWIFKNEGKIIFLKFPALMIYPNCIQSFQLLDNCKMINCEYLSDSIKKIYERELEIEYSRES
ncbi:MAG: hypothetical protein ISS16_07760 [Ignavibacteria bacterium]|nr:hypothetical protein [Ignavibacteria bacterium]